MSSIAVASEEKSTETMPSDNQTGRKSKMLKARTAIKGAIVASALSIAGAAGAADAPKIAVDLTTLTSPFWTSYNKYIVAEAKAQGVDLLQPFNSEFDTAKQITGVKNSIHARRQWHHLFAVRHLGGGHRP